MIGLILRKSVAEYMANFKVVATLGILVLFFSFLMFFKQFFPFLDQFFFSSGTAFLSFNPGGWDSTIIGLAIGIVFLYLFSFFVSVITYSVKQDVQHFSLDVYWDTLFKSAALKIFVLYLILSIVFYALMFFGLMGGYSAGALVLCFIVSVLLMYAPQSIVLDELTVSASVAESVRFWMKNPVVAGVTVLLSAFLLFVIVFIELALEMASLPGIAVSLLLTLLFLVPFIEQMKSYSFMMKFDLIRTPEVHQAHHRASKPVKLDAVRLHEKTRGGKI